MAEPVEARGRQLSLEKITFQNNHQTLTQTDADPLANGQHDGFVSQFEF
jgi:hypothetical protein